MSDSKDDSSSVSTPASASRWQDRVRPTREAYLNLAEKAFGSGHDAAGIRYADLADTASGKSFSDREEARKGGNAKTSHNFP